MQVQIGLRGVVTTILPALVNWVDLVYTQPPVLHTQILLRTLKRRFSRHKDDREVYSKCTLKYTTPPFWYSSSSLGALNTYC